MPQKFKKCCPFAFVTSTGFTCSFVISFAASAMFCGTPSVREKSLQVPPGMIASVGLVSRGAKPFVHSNTVPSPPKTIIKSTLLANSWQYFVASPCFSYEGYVSQEKLRQEVVRFSLNLYVSRLVQLLDLR